LAAQADYASAYKACDGARIAAARPTAENAAGLDALSQGCVRIRSSAVEHGAAALANYQCLTRMTRARSAKLAKTAGCAEGEMSCLA